MTASAVQVELDTSQAPFDLLPEAVRASLRAAVDLHYLRKGERLLEGGQPSTRVYVILKGHVQAFEARTGGEQQFADYGPGDVLGAFAVIMGKARYSYRALEDTLCHVIPAERFQQLVNEFPRFAAWFHAGLSAKRKLLAESEAPAELGRLMLTRAGEAQLAPALFVDAASSLAECVRMMRSRHVTCLLVGDPADPAIVTRTDLWCPFPLQDLCREQHFRRLSLVLQRHGLNLLMGPDLTPCPTQGGYHEVDIALRKEVWAVDDLDHAALASAGLRTLGAEIEAALADGDLPVDRFGCEDTYFSTAEAARFLGRSAGWLARSVRQRAFTYPDGSPIEPLRVGKAGRLRFTTAVLRDIAHACHRAGAVSRRQLEGILGQLSRAA